MAESFVMCIYQIMLTQLVLIILSCPHENNGNVIGVDSVSIGIWKRPGECTPNILFSFDTCKYKIENGLSLLLN